jgi:DNA repair exonuclease SbcCD ATPase subunit
VVADGTPDKEVGVLELTDELQEAVDHNAKITRLSEDESMMIGETQNLEEAKRKLTEKIEGLQAEINTLEASYGKADEKQELRQKELEEITGRLTKSERTDVAEIEAKIATSQVVNIAVRLKIQKAELTKQAEAKAKEWRTLGKDAKDLEGKKAIRLAKAKMPLEGLSVTDDCVVLGKIPLSQVNDAKKLEVGLGIAMAQNPELKVILMNGNDLDEDSLKVISKMTKKKGYQIWIERIEGEGGIVIEDGMVKQ